ncbi:hypothetical protein EDD16DRAFT_1078026 [Pisolithus croceorrhizus]|nr:hypothetical protein EDD16DRAFT_1078026 [Pisolithus croceorrhizus]KAI6135103.1 hypothetical protein EV401DRAFT_880430 [Pisolithus croceorrhizus]KAI6163186.1 hypothetical protein EDD17DRAFT_1756691 [Pisolithus thermaeus]
MATYERFEEFKNVPSSGEITPGDIVSVNHDRYGRKEGLVVGSFTDSVGRQILEVQLEAGELYRAWYPTVTRVRRTVTYTRPVTKQRTVERQIYW